MYKNTEKHFLATLFFTLITLFSVKVEASYPDALKTHRKYMETLDQQEREKILADRSEEFTKGFHSGETFGKDVGLIQGEQIGWGAGRDAGKRSGYGYGYEEGLTHGQQAAGGLVLAGALAYAGRWLYNRYFVTQELRIVKSLNTISNNIKSELDRNAKIKAEKDKLASSQVAILKKIRTHLLEFAEVLKGNKDLRALQYKIVKTESKGVSSRLWNN